MRFQKGSHMLDKARFKQYKYPISTNTRLANDWWCSWMWLAAPDSLKSTCMSLSEVEGEAECAAITRGEPASAQHITGWCSEIPRDLKLSPGV